MAALTCVESLTGPEFEKLPQTASTARLLAQRYRIERALGRGGAGQTFAAFDEHEQRLVALKCFRLKAEAGSGEQLQALFKREYAILAQFDHETMVRVYDFGLDQGVPFYTMELIDGSELSKQAPMPWRDACRDLRDVASILGVLHARKLLHRDLSPRNLLRVASGQLKLIDFGALASFGPSRDLVGTPPFVAPEALRAAPLDQRSDLYAL
ncbi:MAG TPA: serine/threonine-protein kinase, partial [Polyangiales bacterium]|nr:serine/threonine-protein kinase [Polyangiales bacterium]